MVPCYCYGALSLRQHRRLFSLSSDFVRCQSTAGVFFLRVVCTQHLESSPESYYSPTGPTCLFTHPSHPKTNSSLQIISSIYSPFFFSKTMSLFFGGEGEGFSMFSSQNPFDSCPLNAWDIARFYLCTRHLRDEVPRGKIFLLLSFSAHENRIQVV